MKFDQIITKAYLDGIRAQSPLFQWFESHFPKFIESSEGGVTVHYGLTSPFLVAQKPKVTTDEAAGGNTHQTDLPTDWVLSRIIAANNGNVVVQPEANGKYRIQLAHLGQQSVHQNHTVKLLIDVSHSMTLEENPLNKVKDALPAFIRDLQQGLSASQTLTVKVICFNNKANEVASFTVQPGQPLDLSWVKPMQAQSSTNLNLIAGYLRVEPNETVAFGFTDGLHVDEFHGPLNTSALEDLFRSGQFEQPMLCSVGASADRTFFKSIARIFGGENPAQQSIEEFTKYATEQVPQLLQAKISYTFGDLARVLWVPIADGLYDTGIQLEAEQVITKNQASHTTTLKPVVAASKPRPKAAHVDPSFTTGNRVGRVARNTRSAQFNNEFRGDAVHEAVNKELTARGRPAKKVGGRRR